MPTNPQPILYPLVNGYRHDFSSVTFNANGQPLAGLVSIDYGHELKPGEVYSNGSPQLQGATRGQYKTNLSLELLAQEYDNFIFALCALNGTPGSGYLEVRFDLQVLRQDGLGLNQGPLYRDLCRGVKLVKPAKSWKTGPEALTVKCECHMMYLLENGQSPVTLNPSAPKFVLG